MKLFKKILSLFFLVITLIISATVAFADVTNHESEGIYIQTVSCPDNVIYIWQ